MKSEFKFPKISKLDYDAGSDIMPAYTHDFGNYVARYGMGNFQIQVGIKLDGRIDFDKLSRAVRLSVDAEPVLGCRFVEDDPPYWKRLEDIDKTEFCSMEETTNVEDAVEWFLEGRLDMDHDPMVKVKLIRSQEYDTIGIKLNHNAVMAPEARNTSIFWHIFIPVSTAEMGSMCQNQVCEAGKITNGY